MTSSNNNVNLEGEVLLKRTRCDTMNYHRELARRDPEYRRRRRQIESEVKEWIATYEGAGLRSGIIRIPVVVHVVYNNAAQNIDIAQINSQIQVLNNDYRRLNSDSALVPSVFASVAADARIEFQLAVRDPNCNATTGITRTSTTTTSFTSATLNNVKSASTGGADPWDSTRYLNIWVCNITGTLLGRGTFPGTPANLDGIVIRHTAFGTNGTAVAPFNLGRTATHEVGHWLNLLHIWGDDTAAPDNCTGSDEVTDTPNQAIEHYDCPSFPQASCSNGPNGDMYMNYMDYTDDACMFMFTNGQVTRMDATLNVARNSILASDGLVPPAGSTSPDLWCKDNADDDGTEPDPSAQPMYISDDIWVRRTNDGLINNDHLNPEYNETGSNFVYVRVRNRGCPTVGAQTGTLKLYWAKASSSLSWPSPWDGSVSMPALMGGMISSQSVSVAGGDDNIYEFPWSPPNPADYATFGADRSHFCLLARIETSPTSPYGMSYPETSDLYANVKNNNNIAWKNITIVDEEPDGSRFASLVIGSFKEKRRTTLVFQASEPEKQG